MYLSRMELDLTRRSTMRALQMPNLIHGAVEAAFSRTRLRNLWRIDGINGKMFLLLVSPERPDLQKAAEQFGVEMQGWETRDYEPLLRRIEQGSIWRFRLTANPTKSCAAGAQGGRGIVHAHVSVPYQEQWLLERAGKYGFALRAEDFGVTHSRWYSFCKGQGRHRVSLLSVTYEGMLKVTDAERFRQTLTEGIGRGKAYGMGMLTVIRATEAGV